MFVTSKAMLLLDYLRIPYHITVEPREVPSRSSPAGFDSLRLEGSAPESACRLYWPRGGNERLESVRVGHHSLGGIPLFARTIDEGTLASELGAGWRIDRSILGGDTSLWRHDDGSILLPFDPSEAIEILWSERYLAALGGGRLTALARWAYYRFRPLLPRRLQIGMRRRYTRVQARREFPRWPIEPALHDLLRQLYLLVVEVAATPVPWIAPWPHPYRWAIVLTHDVETTAGQAQIGVLRAIERQLGYRSSWNFPARRYPVDEELVRELRETGWEVGLHGAYHDGRDLESIRILDERLPAMREAADRWGAEGFRAPATQRRWEWMSRLGFAYDTSSPDTDPYEPQPGGCCAWWPFHNGQLVELPITLPQDHTLFVILQRPDGATWLEKARALRDRSGMALMLTHPDYLGTDAAAAPYRHVLHEFAADKTAWRALPREVASWWRRRAASGIEPDGEGWHVVGPAADDAVVRLDPP